MAIWPDTRAAQSIRTGLFAKWARSREAGRDLVRGPRAREGRSHSRRELDRSSWIAVEMMGRLRAATASFPASRILRALGVQTFVSDALTG